MGMIRDTTEAWYEAMHVGSSFIHSLGPLLYHCLSFVVTGSGFGCLYMMCFPVPDFVPGQTEELIHIFVQQNKDCKTL